jgi:hypothetical protein
VTQYPLVIRNRTPLFYRGFTIVFLGFVALITYVALRDGAPGAHKVWPWIMAVFWASGLFFARWAFSQEYPVIRIPGPGSIHIERGKAFRRQELWTDRARLWIEDTKDSDGDPYFRLWLDSPGRPLAIAEGHDRERLVAVQAKVEAAVSGR